MDWEWNSIYNGFTVGRLLRGIQISKELTDLREGNYGGLYTRQNGLYGNLSVTVLRTLRHHPAVIQLSPNGLNQLYLLDLIFIWHFGHAQLHERPYGTYYPSYISEWPRSLRTSDCLSIL